MWALKGERSLKVARSVRAVQGFPQWPNGTNVPTWGRQENERRKSKGNDLDCKE